MKSTSRTIKSTRASSGSFKRFAVSVASLTLFLFALAGNSRAAEEVNPHEYELKAAMLYHIIEYVDWPSESRSNQSTTLQLGLVGEIPFAAAFDLLNGKLVGGRKLVVKHITTPEEAAQCQALFFGASEKQRLPAFVEGLKNRPILTVSEVDGFAERGGMVNLVAGPNRIVMEINRGAAGRARLNLSSQLLRLAKVYSN